MTHDKDTWEENHLNEFTLCLCSSPVGISEAEIIKDG